MIPRLWKPTRLACLLALGSLPMAFLAVPTPVAAQEPSQPDDADYQGEAPERYAQVKRVEGDVRIRKGDVEEVLDRGVPVAEGDVILSRGRGVLQLGDGTRLAFSGATFQVGSLFTDARGERLVMLRLDQGRLRVALGGQSQTRLRVDTASGTMAMLDRGGATIIVEPDQSVRVKVHSGHLTFTTDLDHAQINAGERLTVYGRADRLDRVATFNTYQADAFDLWADQNLEGRRGEAWDRVPAEIRYYADDLDGAGDWVEVPDEGWCWRPRITVEDWRPYWRGRWGCYAGGMTWISDEPWGFVTHHYGRWGWRASWGWYWIPGLFYSPAWVAWNWGSGYCGWAPLNYWNGPCAWGHGPWQGGHCWNVIALDHLNARGIHHFVQADRRLIAGFSAGGGNGWNPAWHGAPLFVTRAEFGDPRRAVRAFDRQVAHERMGAYERAAQAATGRSIIRREAAGDGRGTPRPFEDRGRIRVAERPVLRDVPGPGRGPAQPTPPADRGRAVEPRPDSHGRDDRGRDIYREQSRPVERPSLPERQRIEPPRDARPAPPGVESPRESRPAPQERPRVEAPRMERQPEPARPSAPAPAPSHPSSPAPSRGPERSRGSERHH